MASERSNKVLRYAVIQGGKVIEDRTLTRNQSVSIGNDAKNTIVVPMGNLPKTHTVFELKGLQYSLCFTEKMEGQLSVAQTNDKVSFSALKTQGVAKKRGDTYEVPLSENSKGSVKLGEITLLFQFVNPPRAAPKMELPAAARGNIFNTIDRTFFSILLAFMVVEFSGAWALSLRAIPDEEVSIDELPDRFVKLIVPEKPKDPPKEEKKDENKDDKKEEEAKKESGEKKPKPAPKPADPEKLKNAVAQKGLLKFLVNKGGSNSALGAVDDVLGKGSAATNVADALAGAGGVAQATSDDVAGKGPKGGGSGQAAGIGDLNTGGGGTADVGTKKEAKISGRVVDSSPEVESGDIDRDGLARFVKARLSAIQGCYEAQLKRNPSLRGKIVVRFTIGENGRISDVEIDENTMGNDEVASCIKAKIRAWSTPFKPGGEVPVSYPFVFTPAS
jgi:TonB family protein